VVRLGRPDRTGRAGRVVAYLVDPRYQHHEAARALVEALTAYLARSPG
jgi:hypothetical protein